MSKIRFSAAVLTVLGLALSACVATVPQTTTQADDDKAPQRILFVGNSYLYYNDSVHNHVRRIALEQGPYAPSDYKYKSATISGATLNQHDLATLLEPGRLGIAQPFDLVILQGGSAEALSATGREQFANTAAVFAQQARASGADVALYMTPAYVEPHPRFDPAMIDTVEQTYTRVGRTLNTAVIPVGLAFKRAYERRPDLVLHKAFDGSHPSLLGTYLAACVVFVSVYDQPVENLQYDYFGRINKADAQFLQAIANQTVREFNR